MPITPLPHDQTSFVIAHPAPTETPDPAADAPSASSARLGASWQITPVPPHRPNSGPPVRANGMTVGIIDMHNDAPHNGEMHPDGDELLHVISGKIEVSCEGDPAVLTLGPGESCIVPKGEWHNVHIVEPAKLLHITPGPGGEHRPLA